MRNGRNRKEEKRAKGIVSFKLKQIGIIRTPYIDNAPYQPVEEDEGNFRIVVEPQYTDGLYKLAKFRYIYVIYYIHRVKRELSMIVKDLDAKCDANYGWIEELDNYKHLLLHIKGIPHNY